MSHDDTPYGRILTPKLTNREYRQLQEAARLADTTTHQYTGDLIRAALQKTASVSVEPEAGRA